MSKTIYDEGGVMLTQMYGGVERGLCFQITVARDFVQLTEVQMDAIVMAYGTSKQYRSGRQHPYSPSCASAGCEVCQATFEKYSR